MFQHNLKRGVELHQMVSTCPKIRDSLMTLIKRIISLIHAERYDPKSVEFIALSPAGEPDKMLLVLERAYYSSAPIIEPEVHPSDPSYQLTSYVDSLYKAVVGYNGAVEGFFQCCPGLANATYSVANYLYERWYSRMNRDIRFAVVWDTYDWWVSHDLLITGNING